MLSFSVSAYSQGILDKKPFSHSYYDHDDKGHAAAAYIDSRVTHYCWVDDENGRVLDSKFFGAWLNVPRAQRNAIQNCVKNRDESYCQANVKCLEKSRPSYFGSWWK